uniref:Pleckstrin homology and RUN domain containing M1 n=1 Tax=Homo sapiens TaxID=9606 RepID=A0A8V8TPC5_HUMAN
MLSVVENGLDPQAAIPVGHQEEAGGIREGLAEAVRVPGHGGH